MANPDVAAGRTSWFAAFLLLACGVVAATHIGKVAPAIPILQAELSIGDVAASVMLSSITLAGALIAYPLGKHLQRYPPANVLPVALLWLGASSLLGSTLSQAPFLLIARAAESFGFLIVILTVPSLLGITASSHDRRYVMALWGVYMPVGTSAALLLAPAMLRFWGWASVWFASGFACVTMAVVCAVALRRQQPRSHPPRETAINSRIEPRLQLDLIRLSVVFALYAAIYLAVLGLLPTALYGAGISIGLASTATGLAVLLNAPGNYLAAHLLRRGMSLPWGVATGAVGASVSSWMIYSDRGPVALTIASSFFFSFVCGFIPASVFGQLNRVSDSPGLSGATGILVQGSSLGQLVGPPSFVIILHFAGSRGPYYGPAVITGLAMLMVWLGGQVRK